MGKIKLIAFIRSRQIKNVDLYAMQAFDSQIRIKTIEKYIIK